jgi:hypothetical protein
MQLQLTPAVPRVLVLRSTVACLGVPYASISKEKFIVEIILLIIRIVSFQPCRVIRESLVVHHFLFGGLCLSERHFFTDIHFFLLYLFFPFPAYFFNASFALDFPHSVVDELPAFLCLSGFVPFFLIPLILFVFFPRFKGGLSESFFLFLVLFVVHTPLYFGFFFQFYLGLSLRNVE